MKHNTKPISIEYLDNLKPSYKAKGYPIPKWIVFCETMLNKGWRVELYRSKSTISKYVYILKNHIKLKIRFSNHKANYNQEQKGDSDYYVGKGHNGIITTEQLIEKIKNDYEKETGII